MCLSTYIADTDYSCRAYVCMLLRIFGPGIAGTHAAAISACTLDCHPAVRYHACRTLGSFGHDVARPHLAQMAGCLADEVAYVRAAAHPVLGAFVPCVNRHLGVQRSLLRRILLAWGAHCFTPRRSALDAWKKEMTRVRQVKQLATELRCRRDLSQIRYLWNCWLLAECIRREPCCESLARPHTYDFQELLRMSERLREVKQFLAVALYLLHRSALEHVNVCSRDSCHEITHEVDHCDANFFPDDVSDDLGCWSSMSDPDLDSGLDPDYFDRGSDFDESPSEADYYYQSSPQKACRQKNWECQKNPVLLTTHRPRHGRRSEWSRDDCRER